MINILADIARNSRTKQRLIKEKFERTDLLLAEGREREMARVLEASESMKQRNYKRNSQRLQSFLYECKKKRLLEIKWIIIQWANQVVFCLPPHGSRLHEIATQRPRTHSLLKERKFRTTHTLFSEQTSSPHQRKLLLIWGQSCWHTVRPWVWQNQGHEISSRLPRMEEQ